MTDEELIARAEDLIAAWNHRDVDRIVSAFCVEARFNDITRPQGMTGREAVRIDAETLLETYPDLELELRRTVAAGHVVTQEWIARSRQARFERAAVTVSDYDLAGRIAHYVRYWDHELSD
jgi:hypothetical protein